MALLWTVEYVGGALKVRRHRSQAEAESYRDEVNAAAVGSLYPTGCDVTDGDSARLIMVDRLERNNVGLRSRLMRLSLRKLAELTDEFCC
ncbi:hypothetical protein [Bifidobacterium adolescentis]|jgi:hypothetical protein|uniref:hypothetical protein n=1 Tax=Bifidobacterium adolescentis TaxID=1680 RepID=UPI00206E1CFD|nr:hypothetical protein [Bifidobacterium adolescentis]DAL93742.1 MAG TPA: hypothetical protein [Caudoviricetes sp.]